MAPRNPRGSWHVSRGQRSRPRAALIQWQKRLNGRRMAGRRGRGRRRAPHVTARATAWRRLCRRAAALPQDRRLAVTLGIDSLGERDGPDVEADERHRGLRRRSRQQLLRPYGGIGTDHAQRRVMLPFPLAPARVLDIGAGTGRDAAGFAALGHSVVAVEPTVAFRVKAMELHPSPRIEWVDDGLPELATIARRGAVFDLVMLTAVWMHLDVAPAPRALPVVAGLVAPGGKMMLTQRHGPIPPGRRACSMFQPETRRSPSPKRPAWPAILRLQHDDSALVGQGSPGARLVFAKRIAAEHPPPAPRPPRSPPGQGRAPLATAAPPSRP